MRENGKLRKHFADWAFPLCLLRSAFFILIQCQPRKSLRLQSVPRRREIRPADGRNRFSIIAAANAIYLATRWRPIGEICESFLNGWGGGKLQELTIRDLGDYAGWLNGRNLAPASVARHLVSLKVFFRYLQLEGVMKENLAELLGSQKLWQRVPQVLSPEMIDKLLEAPQRHDLLWRRDRAMLELLYATGCRASEVSNLRSDDVHLTQGFCLVRGKGDKERLVPLGGRAIAAVKEYLEHERPALTADAAIPARWLLVSRRGRRLRRERIWELVKRNMPPELARRPAWARTRCGTVLPRICWPAEPTCGKCRKCWAMPAFAPRKFTRTSITHG